MTSESSLELLGVSVFRNTSGGAGAVLRELTLSVRHGERVALIGPNGAGKTSLLLALVGAVPFEGTIRVGGEPLTRETLAAARAKLGFVFSDPQDQLFLRSVHDEVAFGPRQRAVSEREVGARVLEALARVGLAGFEQRAPGELSLGEQRRLTVATVLSCEPRILLLDEPTASLDPRARRSMIETIAKLDATVVAATHDLDAALDLGARVLLLADGRIVADGVAKELLADEELLRAAGLELPLGLRALKQHGC